MNKSRFIRLTRHSKSCNIGGGKLFLKNHGKLSTIHLPKHAKHVAEQFVFDFENKLTNQPSSFNKEETW